MAVAVTLYETEIGVLLSLPEEQRGRILTAILCDTMGRELPEMEASDNAIFTLVNAQVKRAAELSSKRKQSAKSRWQNQANSGSADSQEVQSGAEEMQKSNSDMQNDTNAMQIGTSEETCSLLHNANQSTITNTNTLTKTNTNTNTETETSTSTETTPALATPTESKSKKQKKAAPEKKRYADFVMLTEEEYSKLVTQYGEQATQWCIQKLDNYKGSTGKKYASDYRTILSWVIESYQEEQAKRTPMQSKPPGAYRQEQPPNQSRNPFINAMLNGGNNDV